MVFVIKKHKFRSKTEKNGQHITLPGKMYKLKLAKYKLIYIQLNITELDKIQTILYIKLVRKLTSKAIMTIFIRKLYSSLLIVKEYMKQTYLPSLTKNKK